MREKRTYHGDLMKHLKDPDAAIGYLNAARDDSDRRVFLIALKDVVESWGGMSHFSKLSKIPRITLYKILSNKGNPAMDTLEKILQALGMRLRIEKSRPRKLPRAA